MTPALPDAPPPGARCYRTTPTFTATSTPAGLLKDHRTKPGVWAVIRVEAGSLHFFLEDAPSPEIVTAGGRLVCPPETRHRVAPADGAAFYVEFWRVPDAGTNP